MANNRLYLRDTESGEIFLLAKSMGTGWYFCQTDERVNSFFEMRDMGASYGDCYVKSTLELFAENDDCPI